VFLNVSGLHIYNSPLEDETKVQPFSTINRLMNCTIKLLNKKSLYEGLFLYGIFNQI